jgi:uncharacterized membrane protein YfcA
VADPGPYLLLLLAAGAFAGTAAGLLGVGGGLIVVPALTLLLEARGVPGTALVHTAVGTSLATIAATSTASVWAHRRAGAVAWGQVRRMAPAITVGAALGAAVAAWTPGGVLRSLVGVFELVIAVRIGFGAAPQDPNGAPPRPGGALWGLPIGAFSALVGIGGGTLTVPYLLRLGEPMHRAVGTGAACGLPIAVAGGLGFVLTGWGAAGVPSPNLGYVHLPAFLAISVASMACAPWGARLAHRLPAARLKRYFAVFLAVVGTRLLIQ